MSWMKNALPLSIALHSLLFGVLYLSGTLQDKEQYQYTEPRKGLVKPKAVKITLVQKDKSPRGIKVKPEETYQPFELIKGLNTGKVSFSMGLREKQRRQAKSAWQARKKAEKLHRESKKMLRRMAYENYKRRARERIRSYNAMRKMKPTS